MAPLRGTLFDSHYEILHPTFMSLGSDMITEEDCRRKAAEWLSKAQSASDAKTSANMRRASDAWATLARQIEHSALFRLQSANPVMRPVDLAKSRNIYPIDKAHTGDILRERLHLNDESSDESPE
jgi:hypothetical protein